MLAQRRSALGFERTLFSHCCALGLLIISLPVVTISPTGGLYGVLGKTDERTNGRSGMRDTGRHAAFGVGSTAVVLLPRAALYCEG